MATDDPVGVALGSIAAGATTGACLVTAGVFVLRSMQVARPPSPGDTTQFAVLTASVFAGLIATVVTTMATSRGIDETWRRAVASAIAVFAMVLLAAASAPADMVAGRVGVGAYVALLLAAAVAVHRRRSRGA